MFFILREKCRICHASNIVISYQWRSFVLVWWCTSIVRVQNYLVFGTNEGKNLSTTICHRIWKFTIEICRRRLCFFLDVKQEKKLPSLIATPRPMSSTWKICLIYRGKESCKVLSTVDFPQHTQPLKPLPPRGFGKVFKTNKVAVEWRGTMVGVWKSWWIWRAHTHIVLLVIKNNSFVFQIIKYVNCNSSPRYTFSHETFNVTSHPLVLKSSCWALLRL